MYFSVIFVDNIVTHCSYLMLIACYSCMISHNYVCLVNQLKSTALRLMCNKFVGEINTHSVWSGSINVYKIVLHQSILIACATIH